MKLDDAIKQRRSIRRFSEKKVKWADVLEAIDAALQAPFAGNINNLKFIIVQDQSRKNKLVEYTQQDWIADAQYIIVVCADYSQLEKMYDERAEIYARQHAGAAIQNFLLKITDLGLASCWIGAYTEEYIKKELKIPNDIKIEAVLPIGYVYRGTDFKVKIPKKASLEKCINWEVWGKREKPTGITDSRAW